MLRRTAFLAVALTLFLGMSAAAFAQKTTVQRVVVIKTSDVSAYLQALEKNKQIMKKLGITAPIRVWQATYAGSGAGSIIVTVEYSSMAALADADAKTRADKEYQAWLKDMEKIRTIVEDSLVREL